MKRFAQGLGLLAVVAIAAPIVPAPSWRRPSSP